MRKTPSAASRFAGSLSASPASCSFRILDAAPASSTTGSIGRGSATGGEVPSFGGGAGGFGSAGGCCAPAMANDVDVASARNANRIMRNDEWGEWGEWGRGRRIMVRTPAACDAAGDDRRQATARLARRLRSGERQLAERAVQVLAFADGVDRRPGLGVLGLHERERDRGAEPRRARDAGRVADAQEVPEDLVDGGGIDGGGELHADEVALDLRVAVEARDHFLADLAALRERDGGQEAGFERIGVLRELAALLRDPGLEAHLLPRFLADRRQARLDELRGELRRERGREDELDRLERPLARAERMDHGSLEAPLRDRKAAFRGGKLHFQDGG